MCLTNLKLYFRIARKMWDFSVKFVAKCVIFV